MKALIIGILLLGSFSAFAGKDYSDYSDTTFFGHLLYNDGTSSKPYEDKPEFACSSYKIQLVADAFGIDNVFCTTRFAVTKRRALMRVDGVEQTGVFEVIKAVEYRVSEYELFYIYNI